MLLPSDLKKFYLELPAFSRQLNRAMQHAELGSNFQEECRDFKIEVVRNAKIFFHSGNHSVLNLHIVTFCIISVLF